MIHSPLTIYTANNRKAVQWQRTPMTLQDFAQRLSNSQTLPCTRAEYLALKKPTQDELKDVGGYLLGELNGGRRKNGSVLTRSAAVLDLDNLPPASTEDVLLRCSSIGVMAIVHSTAKHAPEAPRLRVVIPFNHDLPADAYEPITRWLAHLIQPELTWFDRTTVESTRLMYWATHCSDITPVFQVFHETGTLDVDAMLQQCVPTWQDPTTWYRFPGEGESLHREVARQTDPTEKTGIIGTFCRVYDVPRAMSELLPGVYDQCDIQDRYTFTAGSTAGGAVLYDDGKFLYSHHATDPAGGRLLRHCALVTQPLAQP